MLMAFGANSRRRLSRFAATSTAKVVMGIQEVAAITTIGLVVARAVNILAT